MIPKKLPRWEVVKEGVEGIVRMVMITRTPGLTLSNLVAAIH